MILYLTALRGVFVIQDCWSFFQKCKMAKRLVFIEFDFRYCNVFSNRKDVSHKSLYTSTYSTISQRSRKIFREFSRDKVDLCIGQRLSHFTVAAYKWITEINRTSIHRWYNDFYVISSSNHRLSFSTWLDTYISHHWLAFHGFFVWQKTC